MTANIKLLSVKWKPAVPDRANAETSKPSPFVSLKGVIVRSSVSRTHPSSSSDDDDSSLPFPLNGQATPVVLKKPLDLNPWNFHTLLRDSRLMAL